MRNVGLSILLIFLATGCSVKKGGGLSTPVIPDEVTPTEPPSMTALTFGSEVNTTTGSNYSVSYSVGNSTNFVQSNSTSGYKVVLSVQGTVFVEEQ